MNVSSWLSARRATWQPIRTGPVGIRFWLVMLGIFGVLGVGMAWTGVGSPTFARQLCLSLALCTSCLQQVALRTRFQLTARVLIVVTFALLATWLILFTAP